MSVEREIARFLDTHLYTNSLFTRHQRTDDLPSQMSGSDIVIDIPSKGIYNAIVDEKAQSQYINRALPTFSLELSFVTSNDSVVEGWFMDTSKSTEYYLFVWISKAKKSWNICAEDIQKLDYALVNREKLLNYVFTHGYNRAQLIEKDNTLRRIAVNGQHDKTDGCDFYFFYSGRLVEKPINIVMTKRVLLELADLEGNINV